MGSKLEKYLSKELHERFGHLHIKQNYRPEWLTGSDGTRLELDFYLESLKISAEIQGKQHYEFVEFFHKNIEGFQNQKRRDEEKRIICKNKGIKIVEIYTELDADLFIKAVQELCKDRPTIKYPEFSEIKNSKSLFL